ncbi:iron uptake transporter deferrochelatase/peroxidase subunit [Paenibacillus thalictri]|uniref:Deferrochelatase n=1 Tax=Paenibacillus thalictri TaxID=2527873 RepID=A0A4Q9DUT6_9BACL|nr:iron uptake transporter deferrochelatase/peroxidase subunit [Paenibacillus thalictri]TBL80015.1 deferrochelatase/peroxidase EfeB [Paenibacillus thalictri]
MPEKQPGRTKVSRREVLKMAGVGGLGLLVGSVGVGEVLTRTGMLSSKTASVVTPRQADQHIPFYGDYQAGIVTPSQNFVCFAAFDVTSAKLSDIAEMFRAWTEAAAAMTEGQLIGTVNDKTTMPPSDTGEAAGLTPSKLTITFGVGPSMFDQRFGLAAKRPAALADLPRFAGENLRPEWCGGDIGVQVCADDMQVAFHAVRNLARIARGTAVLRWTQEGFQRTSAASSTAGDTPRNLLGFKDGTGNPDVNDNKLMNDVVWAQAADGAGWMNNGSYMVVRRIRMRIEIWDRTKLGEQENTFGRYRENGAPIGAKNEFDTLKLEEKDASGAFVIPANSHVRLAHGDGSMKILRRSYSYSSGLDSKTGQLDAGLLFIAYQRDPRSQFVPMQQRLAKADALNEYISHLGSALFACFPGVKRGGFIGEQLFS